MNNVKRLCIRKGIEQKELAILVGVSQPTVSDWCNHKKNPSGKRLDKLSEIFGVSRSVILGYDDVPESYPYMEHRPAPQPALTEIGEPEIRILARDMDQIPPEKRQKALDLLRLLMEEDDDTIDQATRVIKALKRND